MNANLHPTDPPPTGVDECWTDQHQRQTDLKREHGPAGHRACRAALARVRVDENAACKRDRSEAGRSEPSLEPVLVTYIRKDRDLGVYVGLQASDWRQDTRMIRFDFLTSWGWGVGYVLWPDSGSRGEHQPQAQHNGAKRQSAC